MPHRFLLTIVFLLISSLFIRPSYALEVTAQGVNHRQAVNNALRQAVEMQVGIHVQANTLTENHQVVRQRLLTHTTGFVSGYKVLEQRTADDGTITITLDADIDDRSIIDSSQALETLMKMAAHPRVFVAAIDDDFNSVSSLSDQFDLLNETVENLLKKEYRFKVLDRETVRLNDSNPYRFSDRKNNLSRARRAGAEFVIFIEILHDNKSGLKLRLESVDLDTRLSVTKIERPFNIDDWTVSEKRNIETITKEARSHVFGPTTTIAGDLVNLLRKEVYEEGQRYELVFSKFDEKALQYLEADLRGLNGYVRHKLGNQDKNLLTLSYWSLLKPGPLNEEISNLLKGQKQTFNFMIQGQQLVYRFNDPMFE